MKFPQWIIDEVRKNKKDLRDTPALNTSNDLKRFSLHTVCDEALCPNKGYCFKNGEATFLIMGDICTRKCRFCSVKKGMPEPLDEKEPKRVAEIVKKWGLKYVVFTSPTRDDLKDYGASHYAKTIKSIKAIKPNIKTEPLIPDLKGNRNFLQIILNSKPDVLAHNIETVERLYKEVRIGADYKRSLSILKMAKEIDNSILTKSGIMIGLGETLEEIKKTIKDLKENNCDILNIGQYISPSQTHFVVKKFYSIYEFKELQEYAESLKFKAVLSGPLVRSSYKAMYLYEKAKA